MTLGRDTPCWLSAGHAVSSRADAVWHRAQRAHGETAGGVAGSGLLLGSVGFSWFGPREEHASVFL